MSDTRPRPIPSPTVRREQGIRDARVGKPQLSRDEEYRRGYDLGLRLSPSGPPLPPRR